MTEDRTTYASGALLECMMPEPLKPHFKLLLAHLVNSGLLRSSNAVIALDTEANVNELRQMKIAFLHQSFQEYLTAKWYISSLRPSLPSDISHDAFWREVPIYIIESFSDSEKQQEFALGFLQSDKPDYLTASRLINEITDPGIRRSVERRIIEHLARNVEQRQVYPYVIETFSSLGSTGKEALRANLGITSRLSKIYARAEAHLVGGTVERADEPGWRTLGRSIYILGRAWRPMVGGTCSRMRWLCP